MRRPTPYHHHRKQDAPTHPDSRRTPSTPDKLRRGRQQAGITSQQNPVGKTYAPNDTPPSSPSQTTMAPVRAHHHHQQQHPCFRASGRICDHLPLSCHKAQVIAEPRSRPKSVAEPALQGQEKRAKKNKKPKRCPCYDECYPPC